MSPEQYVWDFFLAHAGADNRTADRLYDYLAPYARVFLDSRSLMLGDDWDIELAAAQQKSLITVVLISSKTQGAYYQREEIAAAIALARENAQEHRVVPVFLDPEASSPNTIPYGLRLKHGLTVSDKLSLKKVAEQLLDLLSRVSGAGSQMKDQQRIGTSFQDIQLMVTIHNEEYGSFYHRYKLELEYYARRSNDMLQIEPVMDYLTEYRTGGPITPIGFDWIPFNWDFPNLDLKIVNNSDQTIFLTDVIFDIEESRLDPFPILLIKTDTYRDNALHFLLLNEGGGEVRGLRARFHLIPPGSEDARPRFQEPYPYEVLVGDFLDRSNVDISRAFEQAGVDVAGLRSLGQITMWTGQDVSIRDAAGKDSKMTMKEYVERRAFYFGPFREGKAIVSGELAFEGLTLSGVTRQHKVKFMTEVWVFEEDSERAPAPPTYQYGIEFEVEGKNYQRQVSISHVLKPQEADRFDIKIGMDKSSEHRFRLKVLYNNGGEIESPEILLTAFVPRSYKMAKRWAD